VLPLTPGVDGVGTTPDGRRVWFSTMSSERNGSLAEHVVVPVGETVPLPPASTRSPLQLRLVR